ncbi:hypothetical protein [Nocardioides immobilis]|nr:hypothetical protein [Nocardioides immobilis]
MPHLLYGTGWSEIYKVMLTPMSEDEARARYEAGDKVKVACGVEPLTPDDPDDLDLEGDEPAVWTLLAELKRSTREPGQPDVVEVEFFNFWGTREASYYFRLQADGRLFLTNVYEYEFADSSGFVRGNDWSVLTEHSFRPDGTSSVVVRRSQPDGSTDVSKTEFQGGDFSTHWEPVPAWGDWASITRRDRSRPA